MKIAMNPTLLISIIFLICTALYGCKTATKQDAHSGRKLSSEEGRYFDGTNWRARVIQFSRPMNYPAPYQGQSLHWFFSDDPYKINTSPGCGSVYFVVLKQTANEITFKVTKLNGGPPVNLRTGEIISYAEGIGKKYKVKLQGLTITSVSEIK